MNTEELEAKVKDMYRHVAQQPQDRFHFELGAPVALRAGYDADRLADVPAGAVESFAGVGYFFDLADLQPGETVVDLGSGSGMDAFYAAGLVGPTGHVYGVDFTPEQLDKARRLADEAGLGTGRVPRGPHRGTPARRMRSVDCVISNGVINLCPDKKAVFAEAARVLKPGGRLAIADIISEQPLTDSIVCNADLWASCIGGAAQQELYLQAIESAGFTIAAAPRRTPYEFISDQARNASAKYGVKSISLLATKTERLDHHQATRGHTMSDKQNIETPHERRPFKDHGHMDVVTLGDFTLGRGVFEPGWRWSNDVKPIAGTDSCQTHHTGICLSGQMTIRFDDGNEITVGPGDVVDLDPGHDAWTGRRRALRPARHRHQGLRQARLTPRRPFSVRARPRTSPTRAIDRHRAARPEDRRSASPRADARRLGTCRP